MGRRILLACYEVPGWGGASTSHYQLFQRLQRDGLDVAYANIVDAGDAAYFRLQYGESFGNPRALPNVQTCVVEPPLYRSHPHLGEAIDAWQPDLVLARGFVAARLCRLAAPRQPLIFMTSGSRQLKRLVRDGHVRDFLDFAAKIDRGVTFPVAAGDQEGHAVAHADLIIVHSPLVRCAVRHFFPSQAGRIHSTITSLADLTYAEAAAFDSLRRPFGDRDVAVLCVANDWSRTEKNFPLVRRLAAHRNGWTLHVAGEAAEAVGRHHGLLTRREDLYALLGRTKAVVCPSLTDAAPGVLFEASAMGCNVVATPNCGNWELCHEDLLADRCTAPALLDCIERALTRSYPDHRDRFYGGYAELVDVLTLF